MKRKKTENLQRFRQTTCKRFRQWTIKVEEVKLLERGLFSTVDVWAH